MSSQFGTCVRSKWRGSQNILSEAQINELTYSTLLLACQDEQCKQQAFVDCVGDKDDSALPTVSIQSMKYVADACAIVRSDRVLVSVLLTSGLLLLILFVHVLLQLASLNGLYQILI